MLDRFLAWLTARATISDLRTFGRSDDEIRETARKMIDYKKGNSQLNLIARSMLRKLS